MTTREQALEALEVMRLELAKRPSGFSDQEAAERQEWANATALAVRSYLAQPEGGDVEDEIAYGHFEVKEEDGRHFWFGAEDGWKDSDEIGEDGVLTIDAKHFAVGTVLAMSEPVSASTSRSALRSAKEREAAAVERTVEKAKAIGEEACKLYCRWYDHGVPSYMNGGAVAYEMVSAIRSILAALDSLKETP